MSRGDLFGPRLCMCAAWDCKSCAPAQGISLDPEDDEDHADEDEHEPEGEEA